MTPLEHLIQAVIAQPDRVEEFMQFAYDLGRGDGRTEDRKLSELPKLITYSEDYQGCDA